MSRSSTGAVSALAVRPAHDVALADRLRPPPDRVRREHPRPQDRPRNTGAGDQAVEFGVKARQRVRLLEEGMRCLVRRREQDDAASARRDARDHRLGGRRRRRPEEERRFDSVERGT
jgi:hypothetical protein